MTSPVKTRREGAVLEVTLDRPKANAIDLVTSRVMGEVFRDFRDDPDLRVAVLTGGAEKFFCPGWDLKASAEGTTPNLKPSSWCCQTSPFGLPEATPALSRSSSICSLMP